MTPIQQLVRENILALTPYSSARQEFKGEANILMDANENNLGSPLSTYFNRYPDPLQTKLKGAIGQLKSIDPTKIFLGNGSDEAIDLLFRVFCRPGKDNVVICPPTYGMYEVCAQINDTEVRRVPLIPETFQLDVPAILETTDASTKLIFVCCPNNPTGNGVKWKDIQTVLTNFTGLVVIDEAYIEFAAYRSLLSELRAYPNLVILQTLSKAWGLAGLRLGMAFATEEIISLLNKVKAPYNINEATQTLALEALQHASLVSQRIELIRRERETLRAELAQFPFIETVYPSEANFLLVKTSDAPRLYNFLLERGIVVRSRHQVLYCENCLRISIGAPEENKQLLAILKTWV